MTFFSLKNPQIRSDFQSSILEGLAPDGGLYFPSDIPKLSPEQIEGFYNQTLTDVAETILSAWLNDYIPKSKIQEIVQEALGFPIPLKLVGNKLVLELFHGPTMAFKDVAASVLSRIISNFATNQNKRINVLVATSGDTGGAIAHGFANVANTKVFVLFPKGKVSKLQYEQLTRVSENIFPIEVDAFFDDCQKMTKQAFNDPDLEEMNLTSANSINIGRLLPQIIYHFWAYAQIKKEDKEVQILVPSGNFGNLAAGFFARQMGLPVNNFVAAVNQNDTVWRFLETGKYEPKPAISTLSNAMDIADPSNFPRIQRLFANDYDELKKYLQSVKVTDSETVKTIQKVYKDHDYLLCPHTAVGWKAAEEKEHPNTVQIVYATASPQKFAKEITEATGIEVDNSAELKKLEKKSSRKFTISNSYNELVNLIKNLA